VKQYVYEDDARRCCRRHDRSPHGFLDTTPNNKNPQTKNWPVAAALDRTCYRSWYSVALTGTVSAKCQRRAKMKSRTTTISAVPVLAPLLAAGSACNERTRKPMMIRAECSVNSGGSHSPLAALLSLQLRRPDEIHILERAECVAASRWMPTGWLLHVVLRLHDTNWLEESTSLSSTRIEPGGLTRAADAFLSAPSRFCHDSRPKDFGNKADLDLTTIENRESLRVAQTDYQIDKQ